MGVGARFKSVSVAIGAAVVVVGRPLLVVVLWVAHMVYPHSPQWAIPPVSSQNLRPAHAGLRLPSIAALAASMRSRGIPESGTGTAIHSSLGL